MKAITVKQPWASAIIHGGKDVENRSKNIVGSYRGPLAIVAGKTKADVTRAPQFQMILDLWQRKVGHPLDFGAIIGVVDLVGVHENQMYGGGCVDSNARNHMRTSLCSPWGDVGAKHLVLSKPRPLPEPIPYTGFLGCRPVDDETINRIREQLEG